jgi:Putative RNA methylase family UPF0020
MPTISAQPQLAFEFGNADERQFVLDGRRIEFPEGLRTAEFTHTIHRFPGKFVPQVARELLQLVGADAGSLIADPFCGCGTSLVEGSLLGVPTVGVDFDPLAVLISRAKTLALSVRQLSEIRKYWAAEIRSENDDDIADVVPNFYHWFRPDVAKQLAFIKRRALQIEDEALKLFSLVVFSSIIRRVSNADDQTQKTYVSGTLKKTPPTPRELFPSFLDRATSGMAAYAMCHRAPVIVQRDDSRYWRSAKKVDGIITSPPYIDSIDYVYNQMLEYFWLYELLGLASIEEVQELRSKPVGFRRIDVSTGLQHLAKRSSYASQILEPLVMKIQKLSEKEAQNVVAYFVDFAQHLTAVRAGMKRGAVYAVVVGESYIRGMTVPTPKVLTSLFEASGFESMGSCSYLIKRHYMKFPRRSNSRTISIDYVCCFRNS